MNINVLHAKTLTPFQRSQIDFLWNVEYPVNLFNRFSELLEGLENYNHYIIEDDKQNVLAWTTDFEKDNEIRFSIIVDSNHKHKGLGKTLLEKLKSQNAEFYGWVIDHNNDVKSNGYVYRSPLAFYLKNGFEILHDCRLETDIISAVKIKWKK